MLLVPTLYSDPMPFHDAPTKPITERERERRNKSSALALNSAPGPLIKGKRRVDTTILESRNVPGTVITPNKRIAGGRGTPKLSQANDHQKHYRDKTKSHIPAPWTHIWLENVSEHTHSYIC